MAKKLRARDRARLRQEAKALVREQGLTPACCAVERFKGHDSILVTAPSGRVLQMHLEDEGLRDELIQELLSMGVPYRDTTPT